MQGISRRDLLRKSIVGAVGLGVMGSHLQSWASKTQSVEAMVIGTGYGGAVAALRLAEAGVKTVVLERGRRWDIVDPTKNATFATFENPDGRCSWLSPSTPLNFIEVQLGIVPPTFDPLTGVMEVIHGDQISVLLGAGVGGTSLVNNAIYVAPPRKLFNRIFRRRIDFEEMQPFFSLVLETIGASPMPDDILAHPFYRSTRVNFRQARRAGFNTKPVHVGVNWDAVRDEIAGDRVRSATRGQSLYGINSGAKLSLDQNYLPMAEATGHVEILPLHEVLSIEELPSHGSRNDKKRPRYLVTANEINEHGEVLRRHHFVCQYLFLAAGSIGTTKLLLRAKATGALRRLSDQVGQDWGANGDFFVIRAGLPNNNAGTGGPCGHFIACDYEEEDLDFRDPTLPPPNCLVELVTPSHIAKQIKEVLDLGNASTYVGMGVYPAIGEIRYKKRTDEFTVSLPFGDPPAFLNADRRLQAFLASSQQMLATLDASNQGKFQPFTPVNAPNATAHPLGGATIGAVCDQFGRVRRHRHLYCVDGAFIPGLAGTVNPALTITALAERNMEHIIARDIMDSHRIATAWAPGVTFSS